MAKRKRGLTKDAIRRRRKEGRGVGEGADYRPWLTIRDVPSLGQANRLRGWKTGRVHHLLSLNELHYCYLLEWSPMVVDIREQYPLWPREETEQIAAELNVRHPAPPGGHTVMTSDFLISLDDGTDVARTVKGAGDLDDERTLEKLDIEREYWRRRGLDWGIVVAEDLPLAVVENIKWLHPHLTLEGSSLGVGLSDGVADYLTEEVCRGRQDSLARIARHCDDDLNLPRGTCLTLARHLLASRRWQTDMTVPISPSRPVLLRDSRTV